MTRTVAVVYDGEVFRPEEPVDLPPNTRGHETIADTEQTKERTYNTSPRAIQRILERAHALDLPSDLAAQHDRYFYDTSKREHTP